MKNIKLVISFPPSNEEEGNEYRICSQSSQKGTLQANKGNSSPEKSQMRGSISSIFVTCTFRRDSGYNLVIISSGVLSSFDLRVSRIVSLYEKSDKCFILKVVNLLYRHLLSLAYK